MKPLANGENPLQQHHIVYNTFDPIYKMIQTLPLLITHQKIFLINYEYVFGFTKDF